MTVAAHPKPLKERILDARAMACRYRALGMEDKARVADDEVDQLLDMMPRSEKP